MKKAHIIFLSTAISLKIGTGCEIMPHGGARKGAGRKPKSLSDKLADGNPGRRPLTKLEFTGTGGVPIEPPHYFPKLEKSHRGLSSPMEIFDRVVKVLEPTDCLKLISPDLIADYAMARYYLICAQYELSYMATVGQKTGRKNESDEFYITSFTEAMLKMQKNVLATWTPIWDVIARNSEKLNVKNLEEDMIFSMAAKRQRKKPKGEPPYELYGHSEITSEQAESGEI